MITSDKMPDEAFLAYLREYKPYLFDIEYTVNKIMAGTGYGDISVNLHLAGGKVDKGTTFYSEEKIYIFRKDNRL